MILTKLKGTVCFLNTHLGIEKQSFIFHFPINFLQNFPIYGENDKEFFHIFVFEKMHKVVEEKNVFK